VRERIGVVGQPVAAIDDEVSIRPGGTEQESTRCLFLPLPDRPALAVVRIEVANEDRLVAVAQGTVSIRDPKT
jgi:acyl-coenzyme A thioesterase PaaI-like protein